MAVAATYVLREAFLVAPAADFGITINPGYFVRNLRRALAEEKSKNSSI